MKYEMHEFRCLNCGEVSAILPRKSSRLKSTFHRKKIFCPHCHLVCNSVEIKDEFERQDFLASFRDGEYEEEAKESVELCEKNFI